MRLPAPGLAQEYVYSALWRIAGIHWVHSFVCPCPAEFYSQAPKLSKQFATLGNSGVSEKQRII